MTRARGRALRSAGVVALVCASLHSVSARSAAAEPGHTEQSPRFSLGGGVHVGPTGFLNAAGDDGFYDSPEGILALGGTVLATYRATSALRLGFVPAYTHSAGTSGPERADTLAFPLELGVRFAHPGATELWFLLRAGYARSWHHGQENATADSSALSASGATVQTGIELDAALAPRLSAVLGVLGRLDLGTFQNGREHFQGATAFHGGVFLEAGMRWAL